MSALNSQTVRRGGLILLCSVLVIIYLLNPTSSKNSVIRQSRECRVDLRGSILDVELLGKSSTALGNSGHWAHRVTIKPEKLSAILSQMNRKTSDGQQKAPLVSGMDLTIDSNDAQYWAVADLDNGGILMLANPEKFQIEIVSYW